MSTKIKKPFFFVEFVDGVYSLRNNDDVVLFRSRSSYDIIEVLLKWCEIRDISRIQFTGVNPITLCHIQTFYNTLLS